MIKIAIPFLLSNPEQIPNAVKGDDFFLEGIVFDASFFQDDTYWGRIENTIIYLSTEFPKQLYSLHFPVDNADYMNFTKVKEYLYRFIDLAVKYNIHILVLHSNDIELLKTFKVETLAEKRKEYLSFYAELDSYVTNKNITICIENMPIIGNEGNDVDSIFVLPEDFNDFNFNNIKIIWDIGHWAYTWSVLKSLRGISPYISTVNVQFNKFLTLRKKIAHFQFSSFKTISLPGTRSMCIEGVIPTKGDIDENLLLDSLRAIHSWKKQYAMSLEIQDESYTNRVNLFQTISWIKENIFRN